MDSEKQSDKHVNSWMRIPAFMMIAVVILLVLMLAMTGFDIQMLKEKGLQGLVDRFSQHITEIPTEIQLTELPSEIPFSLATVDDKIVIATISDLRCFGPDGTEYWHVPVSLKNPWISTYERDVLIADLGGRTLAVARDGNLLWEKQLDDDIVNARISRDYITLITSSSKEGYHARIRAFSRTGTEVSWRAVSDYYPYMAVPVPGFSPELFVIAGFSANSLSTTAVVELMNPALEQKASIRGENELFSHAWGMDSRHLVLVGEQRILCLDENLKTTWTHQPEGMSIALTGLLPKRTVLSADFNENLYRTERKERTTIRILDENGQQRASREVEGRIKRMTTATDTFCLLVDNQILVCDDRGELLQQMMLKGIATELVQANDQFVYAVVSDQLMSLQTGYRKKFLGLF